VTSAAVRARQLDHIRSQQEVLAIAEEWWPYRSLATTDLFAAAFERTEVPSAARLGIGGELLDSVESGNHAAGRRRLAPTSRRC
jgi:hypothetical protein